MLTPRSAPALPHHHASGPGGAGAGSDALPYLAFVGAPPLRFEKATVPPDVLTRPAAGAPPIPPLSPTESSVAQANASAAQSVAGGPLNPDRTASADGKTDGKAASAPAKPAPKPILPDDTRPALRPEDFLPYFQIPGTGKSSNEVNVIMPASALPAPAAAPLPPSSATYTQSPK
ncbi:MAG: hypothetical protein NTV51_15055 [Verrucomicrobia bacterium]|nr:hypothetical protein [Verrucomicrobiota bacterium]